MFKLELFNIDLLLPTKTMVANMGEVKSLVIMEPSTMNFDAEGLFSTTIFGQAGSDARNYSYGYIDLKVPIMHPLVYNHVISLKTLYKDILAGNVYAAWDDKEKDFVQGNIDNGDTGYAFFIKHFDDIVFKQTGSEARDYKIKVIDKSSRSHGLMNYLIVEPAGLRDYVIDKSGKHSEDEINSLYRRVLMNVNMLANFNITPSNIATVDSMRFKIQAIVAEVYEYIIALMDGKSKFNQGKWTKRAIRGGTRNVITPIPAKITDLTDRERVVSFNNTTVGIYQYLKALDTMAYHSIITKFSQHAFKYGSTVASLVSKETMKTVSTEVSTKTFDAWMSEDGLNAMINRMAQEEMRSEVVEVESKYYLCLVYDDGKNVSVVFNTDILPDNVDRKKLRPITYAELLYISVADTVGRFPALLTRYPISGLGGIYPTIPYLKVTLHSRKVTILDETFEPDFIAPEYPILGEKYYNSLSPHSTKLDRLGGDHDGDKVSFTILLTDEAIEEVNNLMNSREFYITPDGHITYSVSTKDLDIVAKIMTK